MAKYNDELQKLERSTKWCTILECFGVAAGMLTMTGGAATIFKDAPLVSAAIIAAGFITTMVTAVCAERRIYKLTLDKLKLQHPSLN